MSDQRFDRVEQSLTDLTRKMDKMAELMGSVIRMEEKHIAVQERLDHLHVRVNTHGLALDDQAVSLATLSKTSGTNEWAVRLLIATIVAGVAYMLRNT